MRCSATPNVPLKLVNAVVTPLNIVLWQTAEIWDFLGFFCFWLFIWSLPCSGTIKVQLQSWLFPDIEVMAETLHCSAGRWGCSGLGIIQLSSILEALPREPLLLLVILHVENYWIFCLFNELSVKISTQIYRAHYGNTMLVPMQRGTNIEGLDGGLQISVVSYNYGHLSVIS